MEIKVTINAENKERILWLINQLVQAESVALKNHHPIEEVRSFDGSMVEARSHNPFDICFEGAGLTLSPSIVTNQPLGAWAMFNSFVPGKAALRILGHLLRDRKTQTVSFGELIEKSAQSSKVRGLSGLRGFPGSRKASSVPRFANHLVRPYLEMGMIASQVSDEKTKGDAVGLTEAGLQFSILENPILDEISQRAQLSVEERKWMIDYLKRIDQAGFKEYTTLSLLTHFIGKQSPSRRSLVEWFSQRTEFRDFVTSHSKYSNQPGKLRKQLANMASTFVSSKIALLRELGVITDARGVYTQESEL